MPAFRQSHVPISDIHDRFVLTSPRTYSTADSTLINGLGRYAGGPTSQLSVITVNKGSRYRFRLVSISCDPNYTFSIDNHTMTVIEADTVNSQPLEVDSIQIFSSQRYSFVVRTTSL